MRKYLQCGSGFAKFCSIKRFIAVSENQRQFSQASTTSKDIEISFTPRKPRTMELPSLPADLKDFIPYVTTQKQHIHQSLQPYLQYESKLRHIFAQEPENRIIQDPYVNTVPLFAGHEESVKIHARDLKAETPVQQESYLLPLADKDRKPNGSPAIVSSMKDFKKNFHLFSESSLSDLDWSNVVAAGSSVATSLLPVPAPYNESKRGLRDYYHEKLAPASDVDLFLYGLDEEAAIKKIAQIETKIRDSILTETTTIRTKNAITIVSQYPTRHVQIVLRLYKNVSEILTGFDIDCSCVAFDGSQVWATPRAVAAYMTQINTVDLSRRSPSYENRMSKYSHRGFEVHWPLLDRDRVDPTIFERSFSRVQGLARLLVLEKFPKPDDRDRYLAQRREERGRPPAPMQYHRSRSLPGNIKEGVPDEVPEWVEEDDVSNYHTFTIPYGPKYHAKKIEKLLFTKDLLLNAEWNRSKDREVDLHRHPAFFGSVQDVVEDCCGSCPEPKTEEEIEVDREESKFFIKGRVQFIKDDPGRQAIGSFHPLTDVDWTEMAYVGNTTRLCQAIIDCDLEHVQDWCSQESADVNRRDHTGRTPLQLATMCSTPEIVQFLIDHGARMVSRMVDGFTALHIAARRGNLAMVQALLEKSEENEALEDEKQKQRRNEIESKKKDNLAVGGSKSDDDDVEMMDGSEDDDSESEDNDDMTQGSFVKVQQQDSNEGSMPEDENTEDPDVFDPNVGAWDYPVSPLHLAIIEGHTEMVKLLVERFGADVLHPVSSRSSQGVILNLVLAAQFSPDPPRMVQLLLSLGASSSQADKQEHTALHHIIKSQQLEVVEMMLKIDPVATKACLGHLIISGWQYQQKLDTPLLTSLRNSDTKTALKLLEYGASPTISIESFAKAYHRTHPSVLDPDTTQRLFETIVEQPIILAIKNEMPLVAKMLLALGADHNQLSLGSFITLWKRKVQFYHSAVPLEHSSVLDLVQDRIATIKKALDDMEEKPKKVSKSPPALHVSLAEEETYLEGLKKGSYQYWLAQTDFKVTELAVNKMKSQYDEEFKPSGPEEVRPLPVGAKEKRAALLRSLKEFESLEAMLQTLKAKPFHDMHPNIEPVPIPPTEIQRSQDVLDAKPYQTTFNFLHPDVSNTKRNAYIALFEAAWEGNVQLVKALTLSRWSFDLDGSLLTDQSDSKTAQPPLTVAVKDQRGFSPFSLAALRGHLALARLILEIAVIQYQPKQQEPRYRYSLEPLDHDDEYSDNDSDSEGFNIHRELVDDTVTIEDIRSLNESAGSDVSPLQMLSWDCQVYRFFDNIKQAQDSGLTNVPRVTEGIAFNGYSPKWTWHWVYNMVTRIYWATNSSLLQYAVARNDLPLLKFILECGQNLSNRTEGTVTSNLYKIPSHIFENAVGLGRTDLLETIIQKTGPSIPLSAMVHTAGVEVQEKSEYYQGLSVYGKKRKDWADASRGVYTRDMAEQGTPPLLLAASLGSVESMKYFLSQHPLRSYLEFVDTHKDEKRIQALMNGTQGLAQILKNWLEARSHLVMHAAILAEPARQGKSEQIEYLIQTVPTTINATNANKITPLHLAFRYGRLTAAKLLLQNGADPTKRTLTGHNILHELFDGNPSYISRPEILEQFFALIEPSQLEQLLIQRSSANSGSHTPLSLWLHRDGHENFIAAFKTLLQYSKGKDLEIMDGSGEYPLHFATRKGFTKLVQTFIQFNPSLLWRENTTGSTPLDLINNSHLNDMMRHDTRFNDQEHQPWSQRPYQDFLPTEIIEKVRKKNDKTYSTWAMCNKEATKNPMKRKLVSLLDANEVVKRLAAPGRSQHSIVYSNAQNDEVQMWQNKLPALQSLELEDYISKLDAEKSGKKSS